MPTLEVDRSTLHWIEAGSGSPLVLLHAFPLHAEMWRPQIDALSKRWRVIAPDMRGFGKSRPLGVEVLTMDRVARDTAAILDHLGVKRAAIAGLSIGGYVTFELWRQRRDLFAAMILADTKAGADSDEGRAGRETFAKNAIANGIGWVHNEMPPKLLRAQPRPEADVAVRRMIMDNSTDAVAAAQRGMAVRPDSAATLATIDVPALILVGDGDALTPPPESAKLKDAIPRATLATIPDAGHISNLENPLAFNEALEAFLSRFMK